MEFTDKDLEHLERLARVKLAGPSRENLRGQLSRIIEFVKQLQAVDTAGFDAAGATVAAGTSLREDVPRPCLPREEILGAAPERRDEFFGVPPVIDTEDA